MNTQQMDVFGWGYDGLSRCLREYTSMSKAIEYGELTGTVIGLYANRRGQYRIFSQGKGTLPRFQSDGADEERDRYRKFERELDIYELSNCSLGELSERVSLTKVMCLGYDPAGMIDNGRNWNGLWVLESLNLTHPRYNRTLGTSLNKAEPPSDEQIKSIQNQNIQKYEEWLKSHTLEKGFTIPVLDVMRLNSPLDSMQASSVMGLLEFSNPIKPSHTDESDFQTCP